MSSGLLSASRPFSLAPVSRDVPIQDGAGRLEFIIHERLKELFSGGEMVLERV